MSQMPPVPPPPPFAFAQQYQTGKTSGLAMAAMICGIVGLVFPPLALAGLVMGIIALVKHRASGGNTKAFAITGTITGALGVLMVPCMIAILLPALNRAREAANRIHCASNLRQIAMACKLYANENKELLYPPDITTMAITEDITAPVFICPSTNDISAGTGDPKIWAPKVSIQNKTCSYIYVPGFTDNASADTVIAYEPLSNHDGDGSNFMYADGHVDWLTSANAKQLIAQIQAGQNPPPLLK